MEKKEFKRALREVLEVYGFVKVKNCYYYSNEDIIIVIATQKSDYSEAYYINYGFVAKSINEGVVYPKDNQCDLSARFLHYENKDDKKGVGLFELDNLDYNKLQELLKRNVDKSIVPVINSGIREYFRIEPNAKYIATLKLKKHLGLDD